jgi:Mg2+/Co2+ transporter CorC
MAGFDFTVQRADARMVEMLLVRRLPEADEPPATEEEGS